MDAARADQPLLFDSLPETEPPRRKPRRARAAPEPMAVDSVSEPIPTRPPPPALPFNAPAPPTAADPAALTNPELRALVRALPDLRLGYLLTEAARELKQRVQPGDPEEGAGEDVPAEPNPTLLSAARQTVAALSGEED